MKFVQLLVVHAYLLAFMATIGCGSPEVRSVILGVSHPTAQITKVQIGETYFGPEGTTESPAMSLTSDESVQGFAELGKQTLTYTVTESGNTQIATQEVEIQDCGQTVTYTSAASQPWVIECHPNL